MSNFDALRTIRAGEPLQEKRESRLKGAAMVGGGLLMVSGMYGISILSLIVRAAAVLFMVGVAFGQFGNGEILWGCLSLFIGVPLVAMVANWAAPWLIIFGIIALVVSIGAAILGISLSPVVIFSSLWSLLGTALWLIFIFSVGAWVIGWFKERFA